MATAAASIVPGFSRLRAEGKLSPLVIGILTDRSGLGAVVSGPPLAEAVRMAVGDTGTLPDRRPVAIVTDEFLMKADDALTICRRWFAQGVCVVVDVPGATAASAVQAFARSQGQSTLITGSINPDLTGQGCSPFGSCWTADSASLARAIVRSLTRMGARTWFLVVPDSVLGLSLQVDAIKGIEALGGRVLGRSRHPSEASDYRSVVEQIRASGADTVLLCDINQPLITQLAQFRDSNLFTADRKIAALVPALADIHAAGPQVSQDLLLVNQFYWAQNDQARSFANRFFAATGQMPDAAHAAAYVAVRHYLRAVAVVESLDADLINQEMHKTPVYFFGRSARLRLDGRLAIDLTLQRVKSGDRMASDWDHYETLSVVPASDIYPPLNQSGCSIAL